MSHPASPRPSDSGGGGDPWAAFGYLVSGVAGYGLLGWGLGTWLHASYLIPVGIVVGAVLGLVLVYYRFGRPTDGSIAPTDIDDSAGRDTRPGPDTAAPGQSADDRGEVE